MPISRWTAGLVAAASLAIGAWAGVLAVDEDVPDFALQMTDGKTAKLSTWKDRTVVLFLFGTWSKKAPDDAARFAGLAKGREKQALTLIGVARDAKPADAKKFAEANKLTFLQAGDPDAEVYHRFAEKGVPWVVVVDRAADGRRKLRYAAAGVQEEDVDAVLTDLLGKREEPAEDPAAKGEGAAK